MAELLVKAVDATHPDPVKDQRGCWKRGDVVAVFEDGHEWGREEGPPTFEVVRMPGVPAADVQHLLERETRPVAALPEFGLRARDETVRRRRVAIDLDSVRDGVIVSQKQLAAVTVTKD